MSTKAVPPGAKRNWVELLDAPYDGDPEVVVVLCPTNAQFTLRFTPDKGKKMVCMEVGEETLGLQVIEPQVDLYEAQRLCFQAMNGRMATPAYMGRLSKIPQKFLMSEDFKPIAFLRGAMSAPYANLRREMSKYSTQEKQ